MSIKIVIVGAAGRMGKTLIRCLARGAQPDLELVGAVDLWDAPERGQDAGRAAGVQDLGIPIGSDLAAVAPAAEVIVDFGGAHGTAGNAPRCAQWRKAMVIGTTGLNAEQTAAVEAAAREIPIVWSPNMSVGVNLLLDLVERAARVLKDRGYDIEIVERHHRQKKDAPSGTALALGRAAAAGYGLDLTRAAVHGRSGQPGTRTPGEIGFHAVRGGDFVGDHTVLFAAEGESLELSHRATSRETFALGALRAARWAAGRAPGLYTMRDVLDLRPGG